MRAPARWANPTTIEVGEQARMKTTSHCKLCTTRPQRHWMHAQNKLKMEPNRRWKRPNRRWMLTTSEMKYREMQVYHQE